MVKGHNKWDLLRPKCGGFPSIVTCYVIKEKLFHEFYDLLCSERGAAPFNRSYLAMKKRSVLIEWHPSWVLDQHGKREVCVAFTVKMAYLITESGENYMKAFILYI